MNRPRKEAKQLVASSAREERAAISEYRTVRKVLEGQVIERDILGQQAYSQILSAAKQFERFGEICVEGIPKDANALPNALGSSTQYVETPDGLTTALRGVTAGAASGPALSGAAYFAVGQFGSASTGTAIASLNGAAASNATLAALGGGSLASGGGGMAAGTVVLGGLAVVPVVLVGGFIYVQQGKKQLSQARRHASRVKANIATIEGATKQLDRLVDRSEQIMQITKILSETVENRVAEISGWPNAELDSMNSQKKSYLDLTWNVTRLLFNAIAVPVWTERLNPTRKSLWVIRGTEQLLGPVTE